MPIRLPSEFDLHALHVFVMTVELGGMSQCAAHLQITQSAVSQTIAKLEAGIGAPLFDRTMRPMGMTASGKALYAHGQVLIDQARSTYDAVREGAGLPISNINVAMSYSLANLFTAPILSEIGDLAERWTIRSGISMEHQGDFLARDIDMLVSGSFNLEHRGALDLHPVFEESFIVVVPADYTAPIDLPHQLPPLPLVRFSHLTGMGQQIERQIVRIKLRLPRSIEVESSHQQLGLVAAGVGWTITTPVCLAVVPELHSALRAEPMTRGRFTRRVQVVSRSGELGDIPRATAALCQRTLRGSTLSKTFENFPWIEQQFAWPRLAGVDSNEPPLRSQT